MKLVGLITRWVLIFFPSPYKKKKHLFLSKHHLIYLFLLSFLLYRSDNLKSTISGKFSPLMTKFRSTSKSSAIVVKTKLYSFLTLIATLFIKYRKSFKKYMQY